MNDASIPVANAAEAAQNELSPERRQQMVAAALRLRQFKTSFSGAGGVVPPIVLAVLKVFRIDVPAQSDFPCVLALEPFETAAENVPALAREAMQPMIRGLQDIGFCDPVWHWMPCAMAIADTVLVSMRHPSGQVIGRVTCHLMRIKRQPIVFVQFFSEVSGGQMLLTWPRGFELARPQDWTVQKVSGKPKIGEMFSTHRKKLLEVAGAKTVSVFPTPDSVREFTHRRNRQLMDHNLARGIVAPLKPAESERLAKRLEFAQTARGISTQHADVLGEIARLQEKTANWGTTIFILVLSLFAFIGAGVSREKWDGKFLLILLGVLFIHELGHYFAMMFSGYRNLRMFFIPFMGAAVSGQSYNVPGWKKTIVSLMGPVPGIVLAVPLGFVGVFFGSQTLCMIAIMALLLNALNLLPILPLDGGWVLHHVLFSRNVYLEIVFRLVAVGLLVLASLGLSDRFLIYFAIATAVQIPFIYKQAQIVATLRRAKFAPVSHDDQTIAPEAAVPIIEHVKVAFPKNLSTRMAATHTIAIFDRLNSTPPSWAVSILFLFFHGGCFVFACLCALAFALGMHGGFEGMANAGKLLRNYAAIARASAGRFGQEITPATVEVIAPPPAKAIHPIMLCANYKSHAAAIEAGRRIKAMAPPEASCLAFGQTLMVSLPADDDALREKLYAAISEGSTDSHVRRPDQRCTLMLQYRLPSKDQEPPIVKELGAFLSGPARERDYAPWDTSDPRSAESRARNARLLRLCRDIQHGDAPDREDPASKDFARKYDEAMRKGDRAVIKKMMADMEAQRKQTLIDRVARLTKENPEFADYLKSVAEAVNKSGDAALYKDLPALTEPYLDLMPKGTPNLMGVIHGTAWVIGNTLTIDVSLISPEHSAPELIRWLQIRGFEKATYQLVVSPSADTGAFGDEEN